jgi:hypothetical protein
MSADMTIDEAYVWGLAMKASLMNRDATSALELLKQVPPTRRNFRWVLTVIPALAAEVLKAQDPYGVFASPIIVGEPNEASRVASQIAATAYNVDGPMQQDIITVFLDRVEVMDAKPAADLMFEVVMLLVGFLRDSLAGRGQVSLS